MMIHRGVRFVESKSLLAANCYSSPGRFDGASTTAARADHDRSAAESPAAWECADDRNVVHNDPATARTAGAARIAVIAVDYTTTQNDADHGSNPDTGLTASATHASVADSACVSDGAWTRTGKGRFLHGLRRRLRRSRLYFGAHLGFFHLDRSGRVSRRGLVLRYAL